MRGIRFACHRAAIALSVLLPLSGCVVHKYTYMDFSGNEGIQFEKYAVPTAYKVIGAASIPIMATLKNSSGGKFLLHIDEKSYGPNVAIKYISSDLTASSHLELANTGEVDRGCLSYEFDRGGIKIRLLDVKSCSGVLVLRLIDADKKPVFTKSIRYKTVDSGLMLVPDGL